MLSRVADSLYWMSRYIERAENVARYISVNLNLSLDFSAGVQQQWEPLVLTTGDEDDFKERFADYSRENVIHFLTFDLENPNSIVSCLRTARENARSVRDRISKESWEHINQFYLKIKDSSRREDVMHRTFDYYEDVRGTAQQFVGILDATTTHGEGFHFCRLGQMIERADKTSRILDVKYHILLPDASHVGSPFDDTQWAALLRSASGLEMYRQQYGRINYLNVVNFLCLDRFFPRSILYCLTEAETSLHQITGTPMGTWTCPPEQLLGQLRSRIAYKEAETVIRQGLHESIDHLQCDLIHLGEAIHEQFFAMRSYEPTMAANQYQKMR